MAEPVQRVEPSPPTPQQQRGQQQQQREDDLALMRGIAARHPLALRTLYDRYASLVFTLAIRILRDREAAEELLTDVFWELWSRGDRFDASRGSPLAYLTTLTRSRAIDRTRSRGKLRAVSFESDEASGQSASSAAAVNPANQSLLAERADIVRRAIDQLDPQQRQAIECSFFDGLSHSEIARKLDKPLGTVKTNIRQGLIRLREALRSAYGGAG